MNKIISKIADLFETRKLMSLSLVATFCVLALTGSMEVTAVKEIVLMVVAFYFGKSSTTESTVTTDTTRTTDTTDTVVK